MTLYGFSLVLGATVFFTSVDLLRKLATERLPLVPVMVWMALGAAPLFGLWWWGEGAALPIAAYWLPGLLSGVLNIGANLGLLRAVQIGELSAVVPLLSLTPVVTSLVSIVVLGELPTSRQWLGIVLVVGGAFLLQMQSERTSDGSLDADGRAEHRRRVRHAAVWMVAVVTLWSVALPLDKLAAAASDAAFHGAMLHIVSGLGPLLYLIARRQTATLSQPLRHPWILLGLIGFGFAAIACQLMALSVVFAGMVETIKRGIASPLALALGAVIFGEKIGWLKALAVLVMMAGVGLVLL